MAKLICVALAIALAALPVQCRGSCAATVYEHYDFTGWAVMFPTGHYDFRNFLSKTAVNDQASAIRVSGKGCIAILYQHEGFEGRSATFSEGHYGGRSFVAQGVQNDEVSAIKVVDSRVRAQEDELLRREAELLRLKKHKEQQAAEQRKLDELVINYPVPDYLKHAVQSRRFNIAITGDSGVGKSHLINAIRGVKRQESTWAPVGVDETTMTPTQYRLSNKSNALIWDLAGAGTLKWPFQTYAQIVGLRHFNLVLIVYASRFTEIDLALIHHLKHHAIPVCVVRQKVNTDIVNNEMINDMPAEQTVLAIKEDVRKQGVTDMFLVDSFMSEAYDFPKLIEYIYSITWGARLSASVM